MSVNLTSSSSSSSSTYANLLQQLNTISTPGGSGLPVTTYAQEMQAALQLQLTTGPENQISAYTQQTKAMNALQSALQSLQSASYTLSASQNWTAVTGTSSNPSDFTISVSSGAQPSIYSVDIMNLARNQVDVGATTFAYATSTFTTAGTFVITPDSGTALTLTIGTTETLQDLANQINDYTSGTTGTNVQAGIIYNGSSYQLSLSSDQTGADYGFSVTDLSSIFGTMTTVSATDAQMSLDGITITSQNNTFVNAIPNVTINAVATGTGTISLNSDSSTAVNAVQTWMTAYNNVVDLLNQDTAATTTASGTQPGVLGNDATATNLLSGLPSYIMQTVSNAASPSLTSLAAIGIVVDPTTGHLEFQPSGGFGIGSANVSLPDGKTTFTQAFNSDPTAVEDLFGVVQNNSLTTAVPTSGTLGNLSKMLTSYLTGSNGQQGAIQSDLNSIQQQQSSVQNYLNLINQQITNQVNNFTQQLNQLNAAMQKNSALMSQMSALISGGSSSTSSSSSTG